MAAAAGSLGVLLLMFCSPDEIACKSKTHSEGLHEVTQPASLDIWAFFEEAALQKATLQMTHLPSYQTIGRPVTPYRLHQAAEHRQPFFLVI